jgi:Putative transposase
VCGRFTYRLTWEEIVRLYGLTLDQPARNTQARYNVCPTDPVDTIVEHDGKRELVAAHKAGRLQFFGDHARLADNTAFAEYLAPLRKAEWVVYAKQPFGGPEQVLRYLSRYTHRVAISNRRLISCDETGGRYRSRIYARRLPRHLRSVAGSPSRSMEQHQTA